MPTPVEQYGPTGALTFAQSLLSTFNFACTNQEPMASFTNDINGGYRTAIKVASTGLTTAEWWFGLGAGTDTFVIHDRQSNTDFLVVDNTGLVTAPGAGFAGDGSHLTGISGTMTADTGWTANASAGDKTVAVADYDSTTLDGMTAGLNLVLAGFGTAIAALADQVEALTKKLQATEAALASSLLPNA